MRTRASVGRRKGILVPWALAVGAAACSTFDATRAPQPDATLGTELFGVVCDRVGAQSLHEDLSGASYNAICHPAADGTFASTVDQSVLPQLVDNQLDISGKPVPLAQQQTDRTYGVARIQALAMDRSNLIAALDASFPDIQIPIKDLTNPDPTQSCNAPATGGQGSLHTQLADLLGRFTDLYNDGTLPQSTEALGRVMNAFKAASDAQVAYSHFDARQGYRPVDIALGLSRPVIAYPNLRDFANATLALISSDSQPYEANPQYNAQGDRIPVPGPAYPQLSQITTVAQAELANATVDAPVAILTQTPDPMTGVNVLNRPRGDLEFLQSIMYAQNSAFGGGTSQFITQRDGRGYAVVAPVGTTVVPPPFVDADGDGLPDIDPTTGLFTTSNGQPAPAPFFGVGAPAAAARDNFSRALAGTGGPLVYQYIDTAHTYGASLMNNVKPLVDPNPGDNHETLMNLLAGAYVLWGSRDGAPTTTKTYADGSTVNYNAFHTSDSPLVDLIYAIGQVLADPTTDATLSMASSLMVNNPNDLARLAGDALYSKNLANQNTTASLPATSTLWDDLIDLVIQIDQEPGLLADVIRAFGDPATVGLGTAFGGYAANLDHISYNRADLNGPAWNVTTNTAGPPSTPVDRSAPDSGANRSEMQRFVQVMHDLNGVTVCNKEGAIMHAQGVTLLGTIDVPSGPANNALSQGLLDVVYGGMTSFSECAAMKIDNGAIGALDTIVGLESMYLRDSFLRNGVTFNGQPGIGAASVGVIEQSSGIGYNAANANLYNNTDINVPGFWDAASATTIRPKPAFLNRLFFFDLANDSPTPGSGPNYTTNNFVNGLIGPHLGTSVCPVRVIPDPCVTSSHCQGAVDIDPNGLVSGLRSCADGDWLYQRDLDATFVWEDYGFFTALTPVVKAFVTGINPTTNQMRRREDLFVDLMEVLHKHWQTAQGTTDECTLQAGPPAVYCSKDGADSYETLLSQIFSTDTLAAAQNLVQILEKLQVPTCQATDPTTHLCTQAGPTEDGVSVLVNTTDALVNPTHAAQLGLMDRRRNVTSLRNDGTTNPQVTPLYLLLEALNEIDAAFTSYAQAHPSDAGRQAQWRGARSQLVDQFVGINGENTTTQSFADPSLPAIAPQLIGSLRSQLWSYCALSNGACPWARTELWSKAATTIGGPTFAGTMDLADTIRQNTAARTETEALLSYLFDPASSNQALAELLASSDDLLQVMLDDTNLVPFYHLMATAVAPSTTDAQGNVQRSVLDSTTALLTRLAGKAYNASGNTEICANELDPDSVMDTALAHLVTPMTNGGGGVSQTPFEFVVDTVADVNRASPGAQTKLVGTDYENMSNEISEFLLDPERGLEQFYTIVRNGTVN